jgi:hypothetical protein
MAREVKTTVYPINWKNWFNGNVFQPKCLTFGRTKMKLDNLKILKSSIKLFPKYRIKPLNVSIATCLFFKDLHRPSLAPILHAHIYSQRCYSSSTVLCSSHCSAPFSVHRVTHGATICFSIGAPVTTGQRRDTFHA